MGCSPCLKKKEATKTVTEPEKFKKFYINKLTFVKEETTTSLEDIKKIYKFNSKIIGTGHFGTVRQANLISSPDKVFAIKTVCKDKIKKDLYLLKRELEILKNIDHPNIVKFYETYQDEHFFHFVMEFCSGGELIEKITNDKHLSEKEAAVVLKKIFSAVNYLHKQGICHRDLKLENFMYSDKSPNSEIKLIDFGLSKQFQDGQELTSMKTIVGTPLYVAPEVLKGGYDDKCDVWSLGVIMYILLSGKPPFYAPKKQEIYNKIIQGKYSFSGKEWTCVSSQAKDLISKLMCFDPSKRIKLKFALIHQCDENTQVIFNPELISKLNNFRVNSKLKKEALRFIINYMSENEIKSLRDSFRSIDKNSTGMISVHDLKDVLLKNGYREAERDIEEFLENCKDEENTFYDINYTEFIAATLDRKVLQNKEKIWKVFKYFDVDNTNYITIANIKEILARGGRKLPEEELENWLKEIEVKDGKLTFEQFFEMIRSDYVSKEDEFVSFVSPSPMIKSARRRSTRAATPINGSIEFKNIKNE